MAGLWTVWKALAKQVGRAQSRLLLVAFYLIVLAPFALFVRICKDPLRLKGFQESNWIPRQIQSDDLDGARRQF